MAQQVTDSKQKIHKSKYYFQLSVVPNVQKVRDDKTGNKASSVATNIADKNRNGPGKDQKFGGPIRLQVIYVIRKAIYWI